jgi:DNA polymerase-3 subunit epsilon
MMGIFLLFYTETTGMRADRGRVIDIGLIRIEDGVVTRRYETLINPQTSIPSFISSIAGITDEDVIDAPVFEDIVDEIASILDGAIFVAHNAAFDYGFLKAEFRRLGRPFKYPALCTVKLSRILYPKMQGHSLDALIERHGFYVETRHRAYPDAFVIEQFFNHIKKEFSAKKIKGAMDAIIYAPAYGTTMDKTLFSSLPDTSGVYHFYDKDKSLLYIGKSKNIRTRVRSHFSDKEEYRSAKLREHTDHIEAIHTPGELSALLLESKLIKDELPVYNRLLRKRRDLVVGKLTELPNGYHTITLTKTDTVLPDAPILGIFRTMTQARQKLRKLAREFKLCEKLLGIEKSEHGCFGSQIEACNGACIGREDITEYNTRFIEAFKRQRIRTWPYSAGIMIREVGDREGTGAVFFVDQWRLVKSYKYEDGDISDFIPGTDAFDYDTYKILARYILHHGNQRTISVLSSKEFGQALARASGEYELTID